MIICPLSLSLSPCGGEGSLRSEAGVVSADSFLLPLPLWA